MKRLLVKNGNIYRIIDNSLGRIRQEADGIDREADGIDMVGLIISLKTSRLSVFQSYLYKFVKARSANSVSSNAVVYNTDCTFFLMKIGMKFVCNCAFTKERNEFPDTYTAFYDVSNDSRLKKTIVLVSATLTT